MTAGGSLWRQVLGVFAWALLGLLIAPEPSHGQAAASPAAVPAARAKPAPVRIPEAFQRYRRVIETEAVRILGPRAPVARLSAQLHQESRFDPNARSLVGAEGMGQFMRPTAADMAKNHPRECAPADPLSAAWAIRCTFIYDRGLVAGLRPLDTAGQAATTGAAGSPPLSECTRWAFGLSCYNGGCGWLNRDRRLAAAAGADPNTWAGVAPYSTRSAAAKHENRGYIRRIMVEIEPAYIAAGVPGTYCSEPY